MKALGFVRISKKHIQLEFWVDKIRESFSCFFFFASMLFLVKDILFDEDISSYP